MKNILIVILFFAISASTYSKEAEEGKMVCKVKSNYVVSIDEGIPSVYSGIKNSFSKGDDLVFSFAVSEWGSVELKLKYKNKTLLYNISDVDRAEFDIIYDDGFSFSGFPVIHAFRSNWINLKGMVETPELYLKRYYKGDWSGFYTRTLLLDCRQSSDKVDDFINKVIEIRKKLVK
jgi:hypothetical protein